MARVRAKFEVEEVAQTVNGAKIRMRPVTGGSEENESFFKWTPYGQLEMGVVSPGVAEQFKPGDEFYLDFIKVGEKNPVDEAYNEQMQSR